MNWIQHKLGGKKYRIRVIVRVPQLGGRRHIEKFSFRAKNEAQAWNKILRERRLLALAFKIDETNIEICLQDLIDQHLPVEYAL